MNINKNTHCFLENSFKIGSSIFLIVGASFVIPKIADAALTLNDVAPRYSPAAQSQLDESRQDSEDSWEYEPPDFGRPSRAYGSGTR